MCLCVNVTAPLLIASWAELLVVFVSGPAKTGIQSE